MTSRQQNKNGGFVLPTVVISSVMLLMILLAGLQLANSVSNALMEQYYNQLAREAAEAGAIRMNECVNQGYDNATQVGDVQPGTDCRGNGTPTYIYATNQLRSTFSGKYTSNTNPRRVDTIGKVELLRKSNGAVYKTYTYSSRQQGSQIEDPRGTRASKRSWHFGIGAKLDFGVSGSSLPVGSQVSGAQVNTPTESPEGVTTISDRNGQLLFYSDGRTIWTGNYSVLPSLPGARNGNSHPRCGYDVLVEPAGDPAQALCGSKTATQAVVAFPLNKENTLFAVVHNTASTGYRNVGPGGTYKVAAGRLYLSVIDMKHSGYPNGVIVSKNAQVGDGSLQSSFYSAEGLAARSNAAGDGAVVYTYRVNSPGQSARVYAIPVYSRDNGQTIEYQDAPATFDIPDAFKPSCTGDGSNGFGSINFNKEKTRMIVFMGGSDCPSDKTKQGGTLHLFDISGGDLSMVHLASWRPGVLDPRDGAYGYSADFSPSGNYVYVSKIYTGELFRYDVSSGNEVQIKQSERFIGYTACDYYWERGGFPNPCSRNPDFTPRSRELGHFNAATGRYRYEDWRGWPANGGGQVLRGPDDRMYVADRGAQHVSVVMNPDAPNQGWNTNDTATASAVGFRYGHVKLNGGVSMFGLPQMITLYSPRLISY